MKTKRAVGWLVSVCVCVAIMALLLLMTGCVNIGGGRQVVPLPFSQPGIVMDGTAVNMKTGKAAGAQMQPDGTPGNMPAGDQVVSAGTHITSERSTDASLADRQGQASGRESPGSAVDGSTGKEIKGASVSTAVAPGGVAITSPVPTDASPATATKAPTAEDIEALEEAVAAAEKAVTMFGSGGNPDGSDTAEQAKAKAALATLQARLEAARRKQ